MGKIHYNLKPMEAQKAINELCDYLLGEDWYVVDPLRPAQVNAIINAIIVDEIKAKYPPPDGGLIAKIRWLFDK